MDLTKKKLWILDMDGTVYLGDTLFPETVPFLNRIKALGGRFLFFTNNASRSKKTYVDRLKRFQLPAGEADILTSTEVILQFLTSHRPGRMVYLVGTPDLEEAFRAAGISLLNDHDPAAYLKQHLPKGRLLEADPSFQLPIVIASFDTTLVYEKLRVACHLLDAGAEFLSTHPDRTCPMEEGFIPDSGAICDLLTSATGKTPRYFGKPHMDVLRMVQAHTGVSLEDMVVVGDRLYTDIALGAQNGVTSVLVLSGETTREDLENSSVQPDLVVENIGALL